MRMPQGLPAAMGRAGSPGRSGGGGGLAVGAGPASIMSPGGRALSREEVVARLQSLSKEELDSFEAALRQQKAVQQGGGGGDYAGQQRPQGMASTSPAHYPR